jgi:glutamine---fructose-6-phosphate transaminase (isomerizing)
MTVAITNEGSSPLAQAADLLIEQCAGPELSVAATKTYTTQLMALALLVAEMSQDAELLAGIDRLPAAARLALELEEAAEHIAEALAQSPACLVLARGFNYATTFELALKFKELAYLFAEPYSVTDFMYGPLALAQCGLPAVVIGVRGPAAEGMLELADQLVEAGVGLFPISDDPDLLAKAMSAHSLSLVAALVRVPESLSPMVSVIPASSWRCIWPIVAAAGTWINREAWRRSRAPNGPGSWLLGSTNTEGRRYRRTRQFPRVVGRRRGLAQSPGVCPSRA